jgi:hypothetical protein
MMWASETRRGFLTRLLRGATVFGVAVSAAGCVAGDGQVVSAESEGAVEVVPLRSGMRYWNVAPTTIPAVRNSPAVAPNWSTSKRFE